MKNIGLKGKKKLKSVSIERGDKKIATLELSADVHLHVSCRQNYTHTKNVEAAKRKVEASKNTNISPPKRKLRRSDPTNPTLATSFLCGAEANVEKEQKNAQDHRKRIVCVQSSDFISTILKMLTCFSDNCHREVYKRVNNVKDLITLHAKYHKECYRKLFNEYTDILKTPKTSYVEKIDQAMEEICNFANE